MKRELYISFAKWYNIEYNAKEFKLMRDLIIKNQHDISTTADKSLMFREFTEKYSNNRGLIVNSIIDILSGTNNIKDIISPEKVYIVKFPKDVLDKIESGQYAVMKDKTGEILSTIIDTTLPKNRNIVHQLRMDEIDPNIKEKIKNLGTNITNIAIQQQLADLSRMLLKIQTIVLEVKRGQMTDRIGLILSGKNQLEQALQLQDSDPNKRDLIRGAIKGINDGRAQLELALKDEINKKVSISDNKFILLIKSLFNSNYYKEIEHQYSTIQEGMDAYFEATRLLALSYTIIESKEAIQRILEPTIHMIEISHEKMKKMSDLVLVGKKTNENWYENPQGIIDEILRSNQLVLPDDVEYVSVEFSGREVLEEGIDEQMYSM